MTGKNPSRCSPGFSLIELLVVVAIVCVLVGLGMNALSTSGLSRAISQGGGMVSDFAQLARQNASSHNAPTALVMLQVNSDGMPRTAISLWEMKSDPAKNEFTPQQIQKWALLPEAVTATNTGFVSTNRISCKFRGTTSLSDDTYWFYPDGRMGDGASVSKLRVRPRDAAQGSNFYEIVFNPVTATFKVNRP